ncbi:ankyrin repeat domain-containing protein [Neisseria montereyensis]|uniref:Ankyrin repeat domain-containing protein n=1 Tax=Neisseria montereyensis TaxID=2973938 RepID=A0ABT2FAY4_9NEIS|nr:ankyrin repeat domain-containing protein [Neisseria montereyensis]MCS4533303.1 ankyrin repeat domain-containing protein [Neisseria montereyensis]
MKSYPIFPTPLEQLRFLAQCFDLPIKNKKALDDKAHDKNVRLELIWSFVDEIWFDQLKALLQPKALMQKDEDLAEIMYRYFHEYISDYLKNIVGKTDVSGISRADLMPILIKYFFPYRAYAFLVHTLPEKYHFPEIEKLFSYEIKSVGLVLDWLDDNPTWQKYRAEIKIKEEKDKIERWRRGEFLPSYQAIKLLSKEKNSDWVLIKFWLLIARSLDEVRKLEIKDFFSSLNFIRGVELELGMEGVNSTISSYINRSIIAIQQTKSKNIKEKVKIFAELYQLLARDTKKNQDSKDKSFRELNIARAIAESDQTLEYESQHWNWLEARWHLFSGDLNKAVSYYKESFEQSLFCRGKDLNSLIQEALVATAYLEKKENISQRKFLAHLKNALVMFGYEMPSFDAHSEKINHKDTVADWEVDMWANAFHRFFPSDAYFPNIEYPYLKSKYDGICTFEDIEKIKPDYKNPNRKISWQGKRMPQIVLFSLLHEPRYFGDKYLNIIEKLLKHGADVNQLSSANESALLLAVEKLDLEAIPYASLDKRLFDLLVKYPHTKETVNAKTAKREKFPLMQAISTGKAEVVRKILEMGAEVDQVNFENVIPLYHCLGLIDKLNKKSPEIKEKRKRNRMFVNAQEQEFFRRLYASSHGLSTIFKPFDNTKIQIPKHNNSFALWNTIEELSDQYTLNRLKEQTSIEELHEIVKILLEAGADPNHPHNISYMQGYTPLMFAIEINDPISFEMMKQKGGDTSLKAYTLVKSFTCQDIKNEWQSDKINL